MLLLPSLITLLAILLYFGATINVSRARLKYKVPAPRITGDEAFERIFIVQQNTLEQLVIFLPSLWIFALQLSELWANILGFVWLVGRVAYALGYYRSAKQRAAGFAISILSSSCLTFGAIVGVLLGLL